MRDFALADLGEGLEEATVVQWLVTVGDLVELNQPLCLVETAKAEVEVPSPWAGQVVALGGDEGTAIKVGALLARIDTNSGRGAPPAAPDMPAAFDAAASQPEPTLVGYGHDDRSDRSRRTRHTGARPSVTALSGVGEETETPAPSRPLAKPPIRMLARRHNVDLASLAPGSGPGGVITRSDVDAAMSIATAEPKIQLSRSRTAEAGTTIAVRGVRARIAERMTTSRTRIPDATCSVTTDCTRLLEVRASLNEHAIRLGLEPTVTPFSLLARFAVQALDANPMLNSTFDEKVREIRVHERVHLGIGTATKRGLVVTVARDAGHLGVHVLASEMARLSDAARAGTATPNELQGSTFTLSNFGALGLDDGIPIINHPEVAILGVGSIRPRPHVHDGVVVARSTATLTLAFDHRACDGTEAGRFLGDLRRLIEAPELALLGS